MGNSNSNSSSSSSGDFQPGSISEVIDSSGDDSALSSKLYNSQYKKYYYALAAGLLLLAIVISSVIIWWRVKQSKKRAKKCKGNDDNNYRLASAQCGFGAGSVEWRDKSYKCVCKPPNSGDDVEGITLATSCTIDGDSTYVPYCAADGSMQCGCGGSEVPSWCSEGGGKFSCNVPASGKCNSSANLLGTLGPCKCGTTEIKTPPACPTNSKWKCNQDTSQIDCICGSSNNPRDSSSLLGHIGYDNPYAECSLGPCTNSPFNDMFLNSGGDPNAPPPPPSTCGCTCTCGANADAWTCSKSMVCTKDTDCAQGYFCELGYCTARISCDSDSDCPIGSTCAPPQGNRTAGTCVVAAAVPSS